MFPLAVIFIHKKIRLDVGGRQRRLRTKAWGGEIKWRKGEREGEQRRLHGEEKQRCAQRWRMLMEF